MRIAYTLTHPIQYQSPLIRFLVDQGVDLHVIYATDITAGQYQDAGFGAQVKWDLPLLDGYEFTVLKPGTAIPTGLKGFGEYQSLIRSKVKQIQADVVWAHGWGNAYSMSAISAARSLGKKVFLRGETHLGSLNRSSGKLRRFLHREFVKQVIRRADVLLAVGSSNRQFYLAHGALKENIFVAPYVVDNQRFQCLAEASQNASRSIRDELQIREDQPIVLYCAKLIDVKDPGTLIRAVGNVRDSDPVLIMVGDGRLRPDMEALANRVAPCRVRFAGFKNQSELPAYYSLCDLFVLPSVFEPWGLVINEVMNAGKPVIAASCVGASADLILNGINGDVFSAGNVDELTSALELWLSDKTKLRVAGAASLERIHQWGFEQVLDGLTRALSFVEQRDHEL
jgi:glycosyltransferase involved in cell wall biosynthesis